MSTITLIGTGNMARSIGTLAVAGGNTVEVTGRDQSKAAALANDLGGGATTGRWGAVPAGDIVITALLYDGVVPVVAEYGDALAGKVIVDISNPFNATLPYSRRWQRREKEDENEYLPRSWSPVGRSAEAGATC